MVRGTHKTGASDQVIEAYHIMLRVRDIYHLLPLIMGSGMLSMAMRTAKSVKVVALRQKPRKPQRNTSKDGGNRFLIPAWKGLPVMKGKVRYIAGASFAGIYTQQDLFNATGLAASSAVLGAPIAGAARLTKIEAWAPVATAGVSVNLLYQETAQDTAQNNFNGRPIMVEDSSISFDRPAHLLVQTPVSRPAGSWHLVGINSGAQDLFTLEGSSGSIIDVFFEWILNASLLTNVPNPTNFSQVLVGATVGVIYLRKAISGQITPVGVNVL
jgi:hypothetical protein